ncbi:MAG: hypothetical protein AMS18_00210 [Gemmatimonas sp. SG8_17]|nr:MAG: hypothetical protein AMS18_00210 [Gemmatimonas sp. SG8_17]
MGELPDAFAFIQSLRVALLRMEQWGQVGGLESPEVLGFLRDLDAVVWDMVDQMEGNDRG